MILIFRDRASYDAIRDDIVCTPALENSSPVMLQDEPAMAADGVRCCIEHGFDALTCYWLEAYTAGENPAVVMADALPGDWYSVSE